MSDPTLPAPQDAPTGQDNAACVPALPCGTRLFGTVRRNGAVGVELPALRW